MWSSRAPQLGTSQGATATTSAHGPSNGIRAARASKAVGHWCLGRGRGRSGGGRLPCTAKAPPPRGALPMGAKTGQELGRHGNAGEAKGRGVGQLVEEVTSGKDPGEDMEGFPGCSAEGAGNEADAFVENELGLGAKRPVLA